MSLISSFKRSSMEDSNSDDDALIAAILPASLGDCRSLAAEAGRQRLVGSITALEALSAFPRLRNRTRNSRQIAALEAVARDRRERGTARCEADIVDRIVQGPGRLRAGETVEIILMANRSRV